MISVILEDENGREIARVNESRSATCEKAVWEAMDLGLPFTSTINQYGNTIFNNIQAPIVRKELALLIRLAKDEESKEHLRKIDALLERGQENHVYVRFIGD